MKGFTKISPPVISSRDQRHKEMLSSVLTWMNEDLDRYIGITQDVPWFYNERAVLGFFISGLIRKSDAVVLQEFSCYKGRKQNKSNSLGRSDLYFILRDEEYLVESKWRHTSVNERSDFTAAATWAAEARQQANRYRKDAKVKKANVFSLCFEAIYFTNKPRTDYAETIKEWRVKQANDLAGLDFYSRYVLTAKLSICLISRSALIAARCSFPARSIDRHRKKSG